MEKKEIEREITSIVETMEVKNGANDETHVFIVPFPLQGHINPMLQFSKRLAAKGVKVTVGTTTATSKSLHSDESSSIRFVPITDGLGGWNGSDLVKLRAEVTETLHKLIKENNFKCLVYDAFMPWVLDIANEHGVDAAPFFTQPCCVNVVYYHFHRGTLKIDPNQAGDTIVELPAMPVLEVSDLPSFVYDMGSSYPALLNMLVSQFTNFTEAKWMFVNSFDKLEEEIVQWMASQWPIKTIGPTVPSMFMDKRLEDDKDYGLSFFKPNVDTVMKWLDSKPAGSVVYVSFGSLAALGEEEMEEIASALIKTDNFFLWVVRATEVSKLPKTFIQDSSEKGLVINWCNQLQVLSHEAIGCFMTHSGWNSTLEALSMGVPMVAMPQWTDQTTNAKFVEDIWKTGVRVRKDEKGIVRKDEIVKRIKEVLEGEKGKEIRKNAVEWKRMAVEAVNAGGSSDKNIDEFVADLRGCVNGVPSV